MPPGSHINSDSDLESIISLQDRIKTRRTSTGPKYNCNYADCNASFRRLDHLDRHMYKHTGIKKHACHYDGCEKTYSILTHLKRHLRTTHERAAPPQKSVPCTVDGCEKMFNTVCNMQRHIREVHENPKVYCCSHCNEKFTQKLKMRRHEISKHTLEYPYNCSKCSRGFYQQWQYERHAPNCKVYSCPSCAQQFEKWSLYIKHCKEMEHGRKQYKCELCERSYGKPGELGKHVAAKHLADDQGAKMMFSCKFEGCNRSYSYERNLRAHETTAHQGRRFECRELGCSRIFSSGQNLTKHIERDHRNIRKREAVTEAVADNEEIPKENAKKPRKKRKDAGISQISNLVKLSGLTVDKEFDKLLRDRDNEALSAVTEVLTLENKCLEKDNNDHEEKTCSEHELQTAICAVLED